MAETAKVNSAASRPAIDQEGHIIDLGEVIVVGKISKPSVFYVLGRTDPFLQYKNLKLGRSFVDRIIDSARRNPF